MLISLNAWLYLHSICSQLLNVNNVFYRRYKLMENVQHSHLGHVITNLLDDADDMFHCQCNLIGQINSVLCYFRELDYLIKARLMKSYCFSVYGCVLWNLR